MIPFWQKIKSLIPSSFRVEFLALFILLSFSSVVSFGHDDARKNRKPKITGQRSLSMNEGESITISLTDLKVEDRDDWFYPLGFTLKIRDGENYSEANNTITPLENFAGTLIVPVVVNDGEDDSDPFDLRITVVNINDPPKIDGQESIAVNEDVAFTLLPSHLRITDPDDTDFRIEIDAGEHYTVSSQTITPELNYSGSLSIPVRVNDGESSSNTINVELVVNSVNDVPRIVKQTATVNAMANSPVTIEKSYLEVSDPDNVYPGDFSLLVLNGNNYTVTGNSVTPAATFEGILPVGVKVNDGQAESQSFTFEISVKKGNGTPVITNQKPVIINEDASFTISFSDLIVVDDNNYPTGFILNIGTGSNYILTEKTITPSRDFAGTLSIPVSVNDGEKTSETFQFQIEVRPVNDAPNLESADADSITYLLNSEAVNLFDDLQINDVDNDSLALAEISFEPSTYNRTSDLLIFANTEYIKGAFDATNGILALFGKASLEQYAAAIKSIQFQFDAEAAANVPRTTSLSIAVNDGLALSNTLVKTVLVVTEPEVALEIPSGFTPNGDFINDTWSIKLTGNPDEYDQAIIKVYTKSGIQVFEGKGLQSEWDGRYNGALLPSDTYFYTVDLKTANASSLKGIVTLLR